MSLTIESQISNLITERLRDHMICGSAIFVPSDSMNAHTLLGMIEITGLSTCIYPRKFSINVVSSTIAHIKETTLYADMGNNAPIPFESDVTYSIGVPFAVTNTGLFATIKADAYPDSSWLLRVGQSSNTVSNIEIHPFDYTSLPTPSICIYATHTDNNREIMNAFVSDMTLVCILCVDTETFEAGVAYEIIGDIQDCINRDRALWDNTKCLSMDCYKRSHEIIDCSDSGTVIFKIESQIKYQTQLKNARSK
jgi:hypothetical protein